MYLFIDSSGDDSLRLATSANGIKWQESILPCANAGAVLPLIEKTLISTGKTVADLAGVAVLVGKGRFTATRVAVTIVNTLGYALAIPVISLTEFFLTDLKAQFASAVVGQYVHASYSAPARIGVARSTVS
jgi:tRNA A37 threonylcarbamoyladenosine modification protein TsaB